MGKQTLTNKVTSAISRQMLVAQKHSPAMLFAAGLVGVTTTAVLACRATLKLSGILEDAEEKLQIVEEAEASSEKDLSKEKFGIKLKTAIEVAKVYAPSVIFGVASVGALTGSHIILRKRNAGLAAAYAVIDRSFKDYRGRVIEDQGKEKDFEYRFGTEEREIVEEGPNGPETRVIKGPNAEAIKSSVNWDYARVFDQSNPNWTNIPHNNHYFIMLCEKLANKKLVVDGHIFLSDVYDMLGFERTQASQQVGWVYSPKRNPKTGEVENDCYVDFGTWREGTYKGKEWVQGDKETFLLDFNVDGYVLDILKRK